MKEPTSVLAALRAEQSTLLRRIHIKLLIFCSSYQSYTEQYYLICTGLDKVDIHQNITLMYTDDTPSCGNKEEEIILPSMQLLHNKSFLQHLSHLCHRSFELPHKFIFLFVFHLFYMHFLRLKHTTLESCLHIFTYERCIKEFTIRYIVITYCNLGQPTLYSFLVSAVKHDMTLLIQLCEDWRGPEEVCINAYSEYLSTCSLSVALFPCSKNTVNKMIAHYCHCLTHRRDRWRVKLSTGTLKEALNSLLLL